MLEHQALTSSNATHVNYHQKGFHVNDQLTILNTPFSLWMGNYYGKAM
jgi:hypothetical protein